MVLIKKDSKSKKDNKKMKTNKLSIFIFSLVLLNSYFIHEGYSNRDNSLSKGNIQNRQIKKIVFPATNKWFPSHNAALIIYGRPTNFDLNMNIVIIGEQTQSIFLLQKILLHTNLNDTIKMRYTSKLKSEDIYLFDVENIGVTLRREPLLHCIQDFFYRGQSSIRVYIVHEISQRNFLITHVSKNQIKNITKTFYSNYTNKKVKIQFETGENTVSPPYSLFSHKIMKIKPIQSRDVKFGNNLFKIDGIVKVKVFQNCTFKYYFSKGLGLICLFIPPHLGQDIKHSANFYKTFFEEGDSDKNTILQTRIIYFYMLSNNKVYEFYDNHFFEKKNGEVYIKEIKK